MSSEDDAKLEDLDERIKAARDEYEEDYNPKPSAKLQNSDSHTIGYEFLASVISGGLIGYLIDKFVGIAPWGLMGFLILGLVAGTMRANARMKKDSKN